MAFGVWRDLGKAPDLKDHMDHTKQVAQSLLVEMVL